MNLDEAVDLVAFAFEHAEPGDLFIQKADASTIGDLADGVMKLFGETAWTWASRESAVESVTLGAYEYLASRIDAKQVEDMVAAATVKPADSGEVAHESRASKNKAEKKALDSPP